MARKKHARANGDGTLEMHGRTWRARWTVDGRTFTRSTGTANRREAEKRLAEFTAPFRLGAERDVLEGLAAKVKGVEAEIAAYEDAQPALALEDGFAAWRRSGARADPGERTLSDYEGYYSAFLDWLKGHRADYRELRQVTAADAMEYAESLAAGRSAGSFNKHTGFLRMMWQSVIECERGGGVPGRLAAKLAGNPWERIRRKSGTPHTRRELTVEELARACSSVGGEMRALFAVGLYTGLRLGDCCLLDWGAVDLARGVVRLIPRKTARHADGKPVVIPIHPALLSILAETPARARRGFVMPGLAEQYRRDSSAIAKRVGRVFRECGIETRTEREGRRAATDVGFHSLRHTFVSMSANAGVPLAVVQSIVGHTSPAMTRHYFHVSEDALKRAVAALPRVEGTETPPEAENAGKGLSRAICGILDGMTPEGLAALREEIDRRLAVAAGKAGSRPAKGTRGRRAHAQGNRFTLSDASATHSGNPTIQNISPSFRQPSRSCRISTNQK